MTILHTLYHGGGGQFEHLTENLKELISLSRKHSKQLFSVVPVYGYGKARRYRLKNGKFALHDSANPNYDFHARPASLRQTKGEVYRFWAEDENGKSLPIDLLSK